MWRVLVFILSISCSGQSEFVDFTTVEGVHGELFSTVLGPHLANTSGYRASDEMRFTASLLSGPDLPVWLSCDHKPRYSSAVLYGVPPANITDVSLEVVVTNMRTYDTVRHEMLILFTEPAAPVRYEVQLKINNISPSDLFFNQRLNKLIEVFYEVLWPSTAPVVPAASDDAGSLDTPDSGAGSLDAPDSAGLRLTALTPMSAAPVSPLPGDQAGVLLRLGSRRPFSQQLHQLQQQVQPLWARVPCPRDFTRSRRERHFRQRGFLVDWCRFKLLDHGAVSLLPPADVVPPLTASPLPPTAALPPHVLRAGLLTLPLRSAAPVRHHATAFLTAVGVPLLLALLLAAGLTCVMCCQGEHLDTEKDGEFFDGVFSVFIRSGSAGGDDIRMVQYDGGVGVLDAGGFSPSPCGGRSAGSTLLRRGYGGQSRGATPAAGGTLRRTSALRDVSPRLTQQTTAAGYDDYDGSYDEEYGMRSLALGHRDLSPRRSVVRGDPTATAEVSAMGGAAPARPPPYPFTTGRAF